MKTIEKPIDIHEIEKLLEIITPAPLLRIGHFSDSGSVLPICLDHFCAEREYVYLLNCGTETYAKTIQVDGNFSGLSTVRYFPIDRPNYMQHGRFYDYLFVSADIAPDARASFLQKCHRTIKNAGLILIFLPKEERDTLAIWNELLEENYFVATSDLLLDEHWRVVISKKMHGWGG